MRSPESFAAGPLEAGQTCSCCQQTIEPGESVGRCPRCLHLQHEGCWERDGVCHSYECETATSRESGSGTPDVVISTADLDRVPIPPPPPPQRHLAEPAGPRRLSGLAVAAFVLALVGVPLFGVPGLVAIALGAVAVGAANANPRLKGTGLAVAAIVVGVLQIVGWTAALCLYLLTRQADSPVDALAPVMGEQFDLEDVVDAPDHIRRAIRSNVMVVARGLGGASEGSGVVVDGRRDEVFVLTNRHVITVGPASATGARIEVTFPDGSRAPGDVVWLGEAALDVAVLRCPVVSDAFEAAAMRPVPTVTVGESVFAIGNPLGLGWSYSGGAVSAIRRFTSDGHLLRMIQIQLPLNPGHSGGGLYDSGGSLIGINTMTTDKHTSEGIGFALAVFDLVPFLEEQAGLTLLTSDTEPGGATQ